MKIRYSSWRQENAKFAEGEELFKIDDGLQKVQGDAVIRFTIQELHRKRLGAAGNIHTQSCRDRLLEKYHIYVFHRLQF